MQCWWPAGASSSQMTSGVAVDRSRDLSRHLSSSDTQSDLRARHRIYLSYKENTELNEINTTINLLTPMYTVVIWV